MNIKTSFKIGDITYRVYSAQELSKVVEQTPITRIIYDGSDKGLLYEFEHNSPRREWELFATKEEAQKDCDTTVSLFKELKEIKKQEENKK